MKKKIIAAVLLFILVVAGCGNGKTDATSTRLTSSNGVEAVLNQEMAKADNENNGETIAGTGTEASLPEDPFAMYKDPVDSALEVTDAAQSDVDIDLTLLSSTMVYTQVYDMVVYPEKYIGKKVRMAGPFLTSLDESTGNRYYLCLIMDATACCSQGLEFLVDEDLKYPEDYPEEGYDIVVSGEFDTYREGEYNYVTLRHATIEKVEAFSSLPTQP